MQFCANPIFRVEHSREFAWFRTHSGWQVSSRDRRTSRGCGCTHRDSQFKNMINRSPTGVDNRGGSVGCGVRKTRYNLFARVRFKIHRRVREHHLLTRACPDSSCESNPRPLSSCA
jgi:hypothetical protein